MSPQHFLKNLHIVYGKKQTNFLSKSKAISSAYEKPNHLRSERFPPRQIVEYHSCNSPHHLMPDCKKPSTITKVGHELLKQNRKIAHNVLFQFCKNWILHWLILLTENSGSETEISKYSFQSLGINQITAEHSKRVRLTQIKMSSFSKTGQCALAKNIP